MKKVILGIHGLGNKPSKRLLTEWWKLSMLEGLAAIGKFHTLPEFELVYWADAVYDKPLNIDISDKCDPYYLDEIYTPAIRPIHNATHKIRKKIIDFIIRQFRKLLLDDDLRFKYRGVAESILHRYFRELDIYYKETCEDKNSATCRARRIMIERVVSELKRRENCEILLIGHSMGSILAFDAMCFEVPDIKICTFITVGSPLGQPVVLSNIASRQKLMRKGKTIIQTPSSIEKYWYNFSDIEDVVALHYKLGDEFRQNEKGVKPRDVLITNNYVIDYRKNPHKVYGYLRSKEFSEVLSAFIEQKEKPVLFLKFLSQFKTIFKKK